jgi:hypothetical protein
MIVPTDGNCLSKARCLIRTARVATKFVYIAPSLAAKLRPVCVGVHGIIASGQTTSLWRFHAPEEYVFEART